MTAADWLVTAGLFTLTAALICLDVFLYRRGCELDRFEDMQARRRLLKELRRH